MPPEDDGAGWQPHHARLAQSLRAAIADGSYPVGSRLPTEPELCRAHGLSRGTVREALRTLAEQGMISRRPGAGTTVLARYPAEDYLPFVSNRDELVSLYRTTRVDDPVTARVRTDEALAALTGLPPDTEWMRVEGVRRLRHGANRPPLCWTEQFHRPGDVYDVTTPDANTAAMPSSRIEQTVRALPMPERFAAALETAPGSPALVIARLHLDADGVPLTASVHTHPGDRLAIRTSLVPERRQR